MSPNPNFTVASARQLYGHALPAPTPPPTGALPQPQTHHSPPNRPPLRHKSQQVVRLTPRVPSPETKSNHSSTSSQQSSDFNSFGASTISLLKDFPEPPAEKKQDPVLQRLVTFLVAPAGQGEAQRRPGGEIYFSPIEAKEGKVELSSPLPSPELANAVTEATAEAPMAQDDTVRICLTAKQVDELSVAMAKCSVVQAALTSSTNSRPRNIAEAARPDAPLPADYTLFADANVGRTFVSDLDKGFGPGVPSTTGVSLHITPPSAAQSESTIVLLSNITLAKSSKDPRPLPASSLSTQTDLSLFCVGAALGELSASAGLTLQQIGIQQAKPAAADEAEKSPPLPYSPLSEGSSIDWCAFGDEDEELATAPEATVLEPASPAEEAVAKCLARIAGLTREEASAETLTLLDTIADLGRSASSFLILEPTRFNAERSIIGGVRVLGVSTGLRLQLGSGKQCRMLGEKVVEAVVPRWGKDEEFEVEVEIEGQRGLVRAMMLLSGRGKHEGIESARWVCLVLL